MDMASKSFKFNFHRIVSLWSLPVFFIGFIGLVFIADNKSLHNLESKELFAWTLFFVFSVGIFGLLFFNHLPLALRTELFFDRDVLELRQNDQSFKISLQKVVEVQEFSTNLKAGWSKLPWSSVVLWKIITPTGNYFVSSLTISKDDFNKYVPKDFHYRMRLFPIMMYSR